MGEIMQLRNIRKTYHNKNNEILALNDIHLNLEHTGIVMLLGKSGCGKTTLLNCIAGEISFEGSITDVPHFDYVKQEFSLFEDLTVYDNLYLVSRNVKKIERLLDLFSMSNQVKKKVKYLSNGQKKRLQFIRALLHKTDMLLCDEPTASLDESNCEKIMECFGKLSKDHLIIVSTHDEELAEKYADRIIRMDNGRIISDEIKHNTAFIDSKQRTRHHALKTTSELAIKRIFSRPLDSLLYVLLSLFCITVCYSFVNLLINIHTQSEYVNIFKSAQNMIVSVPNKSVLVTEPSASGYVKQYSGLVMEDLFSVDQIQETIQNNPEIIGVESYNSAQYAQDTELEYAMRDNDLKAFYSIYIKDSENGGEFAEPARPSESPFMLSNTYDASKLTRDEQFINYYETYPSYRIQAFDLVNGYHALPLLCGDSTGGGVILSKDAADMYKSLNGYSNYEEIIGKNLKLGLVGTQNLYANDNTIEVSYEHGLPDGYYFDTLDVVIDGVSSVENAYCTMVFFETNFGDDPIYQHYVKDGSYAKFQYVRFLVKPGCDYGAVAKKINTFFNKNNVKIMQYQGKGIGKDRKMTKSLTGFLVYAIVMLGIVFFLQIGRICFNKKRLVKESKILSAYGYSNLLENIVRNGIVILVVGIVECIVIVPIIAIVDEFSKAHNYPSFMGMNIPLLLCIIILYGILTCTIEQILLGVRHDPS